MVHHRGGFDDAQSGDAWVSSTRRPSRASTTQARCCSSYENAAAADNWKPKATALGKLRHRHVRIIRDYGMTDRREAPRYYPPMKNPDRR